MPAVSIILPTYSRADMIPFAIDSVMQQSYEDFELIIINDASTDGTADYLESLSDERIVVIHNKSNLRLQKTLNKGLKNAKGKFIARIDDDDRWHDTDKLKKQVTFLESNESVVLVGTAFEMDSKVFAMPVHDDAIRKQMLFRCPFQHSTVLFRRQINGEIISYDDNLKICEDWDLWARLGQVGELYNLPDATTTINITQDGITQSQFGKHLIENRKLRKKYSNSYPRRWQSSLYHWSVMVFFKIIPLNSSIHKVFQRIFTKTFHDK